MIVGEAHVIVRAITNSVAPEIRRAFNNPDIDRIGSDTGRRIGNGISQGLFSGSRGGDFFGSLAGQAEAARGQFDALIRVAYTLGPAIAGIVSTVSALVGALGALASTVAGAIPSLAVLPGILANLAIVGGTLKLAFSGVGQAISAGMKAASASMKGAGGRAKDLTAEIRRLEDAQRRLKDVQEESAQSLARANEERTRTLIRLSESQADADARLANAERDYADTVIQTSADVAEAKTKVQEAQIDLNDAYEKAREEIQQLNFAAEDAALNQQKAALDLEKARETLLRVQDLPPNARARKEAELAFAQADLNYRKAVDTNKDMAKEQDRLSKEGVDGTKTVRDAKKALAEATQRQAQAEIDAANKVAKAEEDLAKERVRRSREQRDLDWELQDLDRKFADEIAKADKDIADAKRNLKRAQEDYNKALKSGGSTGVAAMNAYKTALSNLGPSQRAFVEYMVKTFIPAIKQLKAVAGSDFFPKLIPALETIRTKLLPEITPLLKATGGALGEVGASIIKSFADPVNIENIKTIWSGLNKSILPELESIGTNAISGLTGFLAAVQPLVDRFVGWIGTIAQNFKNMFDTKGEQSDFTSFLQTSGDIASDLGTIFSNVFSGLGNIVKSQMKEGSGGRMLLDWIKEASQGFLEFTKSDAGMKRIEDFFTNTANNAKPILGFIGDLVKEFLKLGENPAVGEFFQKLRDSNISKTLGEIGKAMTDTGPAIADFIISFIDFSKATLSSDAIKVFWDTLTTILNGLTTAFSGPTMQTVFNFLASFAAIGVSLRTAWSVLKIPLLAVLDPIMKIGGALAKFGPVSKIIETVMFNLRLFVALFGASGVGAVIAIIAGIVLAFVAMWRESEKFREAIKKLIDGVISKAVEIFNRLKEKLDNALKPLGGMQGVVDKLKVAFKFLGDIIGTYVIPFIEGGLKNALEIIGGVFGTIIDTVGNVIAAIEKIWTGISTGDIGAVFQGIVDLIFAPFKALWSNLVDVFKGIFNNIVEVVKSVLGISSPSKVFTDIATAILDAIVNVITFIPKKFLEFFTAAWDGIVGFITSTVGPWLMGLGGKIGEWIKNAWDAYLNIYKTIWGKVIEFIVNTVGPWLLGLGQKIAGWIATAWNAYLSLLKTVWGSVINFFTTTVAGWLGGLGGKIKNWAAGMWNGIVSILGTAWEEAKSFFSPSGPVATFLKNIGGTIASWASGMWNGLTSGLRSAVSFVKSSLRNILGFFIGIVDKIRSFPGAGWIPEISIPAVLMASGGIVQPRSGGTLAVIGEAGRPERVEPLDENGLSERDKAMINMLSGGTGGINVNVYSQPGMDEVQLAKIVSREISFMMRRGSV